jgi:hypothetical protein
MPSKHISQREARQLKRTVRELERTVNKLKAGRCETHEMHFIASYNLPNPMSRDIWIANRLGFTCEVSLSGDVTLMHGVRTKAEAMR